MSEVVTASRVALDWPHDPAFGAVGRLVVTGVASRVDLPVDRIDELGLALDLLGREQVIGKRLFLEIDVSPELLRLTLGTFERDPLADAGAMRILSVLTSDVRSVEVEGGHRVVLAVPV